MNFGKKLQNQSGGSFVVPTINQLELFTHNKIPVNLETKQKDESFF
jgi:hypothetical protein